MKLYDFLLAVLICSPSLSAQPITSIPDANFEQVLVDQNIDSDGTINGQVFTSDIASLTNFTFNASGIEDFTGLDDFQALETLVVVDVNFGSNDTADNELDLSSNINLQSFDMIGQDDLINNPVETLDFSNNLNLSSIHVPGNWFLSQIDLKTGSTDVSNLNINIDVSFPLPPPSEVQNQSFQDDNVCIKVTDAAAANAGQGVYATWNISAVNKPYFFSETCTLDIDEFKMSSVSIYPNPATDILYIQSKHIDIRRFEIYNLQGQLVKQNLNFQNQPIDLSNLSRGVYVINFITKKAVWQEKLMIK